MPFATVAVPFDAYRDLPTPQHRWLLMCLARYADKQGRCWPSMRQLARDARMSKSSVQRYLADLSRLECFVRSRRPGGRYFYQFVANYLHSPHRRAAGVPATRLAVPRDKTQQAPLIKHRDSPSDSIAAEPPLSPAERAERVRRLDAVLAGIMKGAKPGKAVCWAPRCFT